MEENENVYTHTFAKEFNYQGATYATLTFDFDSLTGKDAAAVEHELKSLNKLVFMRETDADYQKGIAIRACKEPIAIDAFDYMPLKDYNKILNEVRSFLLS